MFRRLVFAVAVVFITFYVSFGQESNYKNMKIEEIKFDGLINARPEELKQIIDIKEGDNYNPDLINKSLKKLFYLDMFKSAKADISEGTNGLIINYIVEENYYIRNVKFDGNDDISSDELKKVISFTDNSYFTDNKLNNSLIAIQKKYIDEGFIDVSVMQKFVLVDVKRQTFDLVFKVKTGKKVVVEKIKITGNTNVKPEEIKNIMKTKERFFIFVTGVLKEDEFNKDKQMVVDLYQHKGYIDVDIKQFEWKIEELDQDKHKAIVVYIDLTEGDKYRTGKISITGNTLFPTKDLMSYVDLKQGEVYDKIKMDKTRMDIYNKYSDNGHLYANVSLVMNKDTTGTNRIVDSELVVSEGPRAHIETITISGNTKTLTHVIKREFYFEEGELYIQRKMRMTYEGLMQLQYFSDVKFVPLPGSAEGLIDLDVTVEEARTGLVTFGVGYGTESGFNLSAQVSEKNLFGTGRILSLKGSWGQKALGFEISFEEPWLFNEPLYAGISLSYSRYLIDNITADSTGTGLLDGTNFNYITNISNSVSIYTSTNAYSRETFSLGGSIRRRLPDYWSVSFGLGTTIFRDIDPNFTNPLMFTDHWETNQDLINSFKKGWGFKNSMSLNFSRNSTDHPLRPLYGSIFDISLLYVGGMLGGDNNFLKSHISYSIYWNPLWKIVLALHAATDFLTPQINYKFERDPWFVYDYSDMCWFDGVYEMRGWTGVYGRGESKIYYSGELRFQIYDEIWGLFFYDMGNIYRTYDSYSPFSPEGYKFSFGIGVQLNIPMLPIRFYLARLGRYNNGRFELMGTQDLFSGITPVFSIQGLF